MEPISISVIIPTYNSEMYIEETLETVYAQKQLPDQILVCDDGSTDQTCSKVTALSSINKRPPLALIAGLNQGAAANRNRGIGRAEGNWIAFLDSDDRWLPNKIEKVKLAISQNPNVDLWCHDEKMFGDAFGSLEYSKMRNRDEDLFLQLYKRNILSTSAVVVRKSMLERLSGFDERLRSAQDYDLWLRIASKGKIEFLPEILGEYRIRKGNISSQAGERFKCLLIIGSKHIPDVKARSSFAWLLFLNFVCGAFLNYLKQCIKNGFGFHYARSN